MFCQNFVFRSVALLFAVLLSAPVLAQDNPIPERRAVYTQNMDFYGNDLRSIFDTRLEICESACLADLECRAFTFNERSAACFLKGEISNQSPYDGAKSAVIVATDPAMLASGLARARNLDFIGRGLLAEAATLAQRAGRDYPTNGLSEADLIGYASQSASSSNPDGALWYRMAALGARDTAGGWTEVSRIARSIQTNDYSRRMELRRIATAAAINGFLRAEVATEQAQALSGLAVALENRSETKAMIPALRLSQALSPNSETLAALDRAIALYGFRVVEHQVDANAANPRICVTFSEDLVKTGVEYAPYVLIKGADLPVEAEDRQLCIDGVQHGSRYSFTLRAGLPAASGESLMRNIELGLYVRDRAPSVHFPGRAYVLPKTEQASIPVVSVNTEEVDLRIHRVGERNILRVLQDGLLGDPLGEYWENRIADRLGDEVWSGTGLVAMRLNEDVTTALPIAEAILGFEPGVYAMTARARGVEVDGAAATQWFVVTDIGLSSMQGNDGLHVFARALGSAQEMAGVKLRLTATNNEILGEAVTDASGYAVFAPGLIRGTGGAEPAVLMASTEAGDFAFLRLDEAGFDLSDRGVAGRASPPPVDVFLSTERGAYRPGETVHATILARDAGARAVLSLPLTAVIIRPDGVEHSRSLLAEAGAGGRVQSFALSDTAQRGTWRLRIHADPEASALADTSFLVEDFEAERIDFTLGLPDGPVHAEAPPQIQIDAVYLYGAPGAGLNIEGEVRVRVAEGISGYPGYSFGLADERFSTRLESLPGELLTDDQGAASLGLLLPVLEPTTRPLEMTATLRLRDGSGRPVEREISRPLAATRPMIGVKPLFDGTLEEGALARFEVIAVAPDNKRAALRDVVWTLERIETDYQWYRLDGDWYYEPISRRERVANGSLTLNGNELALIEAPVEWGEYELRLASTAGGYTATSSGFYTGWYAVSAGSDTPDRLEIALDKDRYGVGDVARVQLTPRAAGEVLLSVLSDRLISKQTVSVAAGETIVELPVTEDWAPGAYVTATFVRPMDLAAGRNPSRALGLGWVSVDPGERQLTASFISAASADPRGPMTARLKVDGAKPGETVYATIAAVDLGILNMTGFKSPDPSDHYFGQRKLGMEMRDIYGRLIDGLQGTPGQIRSGGDGGLSNAAGPPPTQDLVAFFSGILSVDADGIATADFDMPDFNGTLRLMAVVWSGTGVGQAEQDVLVRDPVVVSAALPRFMAPGDRSRLRIDLAHVTGPAGDMTLAVSGGPGLKLPAGQSTLRLEDQGRATLSLPIGAGQVGDSVVRITLTTPDGTSLTKDLRLAVRANDPEIARQNRITLDPDGGTLTLDSNIFAGLLPGTGRVTLAAGPLARFDVPGLLSALDSYPYGCSEQITSKAFPLLYFDTVAAKLGLEDRANIDRRLAEAIEGVLANQASGGDFGLWHAGGGDLWLDAYISDFLSRARARGHEVPKRAFAAAMDNLRNQINYASDFENGGEGIAYGLLVLAREGIASVGDLRYYADARAEAFATPMAKAQLGAALALYGDQSRADLMFRHALNDIRADTEDASAWRVDYGSRLRDTAAVLTLAAEAGSQVVDQDDLADRLATAIALRAHQSTQESFWMLMATNALLSDRAASALTMDGLPISGPLVELFSSEVLNGRSISITNNGAEPVNTILTAFGVPSEPEPAQGIGYRIERSIYTLEGDPVDPALIAINDRIVVVLTVVPERDAEARLMVNDPLPAGFEIDNPNIIRAGDIAALDWLDLLDVTEATEFRTDRFLAAVNWRGTGAFRLGYVVRAISPGQFYHPAASVEDMYRPAFRARSDAGRVSIASEVR